MRKPPPISTASLRETMTSRPAATVARASKTAAALLLTTRAASAPVSCVKSASAWTRRELRSPAGRSYSRSE